MLNFTSGFSLISPRFYTGSFLSFFLSFFLSLINFIFVAFISSGRHRIAKIANSAKLHENSRNLRTLKPREHACIQ
jgi:hypothetical protein